MKNKLAALYRGKRQFFLYCLIGASGATLDFLVYSTLVKWGGGHYQIANAIGYACGTALSFILNSRFNFKTTDWMPLRVACFFGVATLGWSASASLLQITVGSFGWNKYLAKLMSIFVTVLLQYNLNRLLSFRKTANPRA
jgi:putative flippase GtrA